jgi:hypothetical protein
MSASPTTYSVDSPFPRTRSYGYDHILDPKRWSHLVPVIAILSLGSLCVPNFALGTASGAAITAAILVGVEVIRALKLKDNNAPLMQVNLSPVAASLVLPVVRELILRGAVQPLMVRDIVWIVPAAAASFLGTSLSIATGVSIVATAMFTNFPFFDQHPSLLTASSILLATINDIALGVLAAQFSLDASIAASIVYFSTFETLTNPLLYGRKL